MLASVSENGTTEMQRCSQGSRRTGCAVLAPARRVCRQPNAQRRDTTRHARQGARRASGECRMQRIATLQPCATGCTVLHHVAPYCNTARQRSRESGLRACDERDDAAAACQPYLIRTQCGG